jgi:hypothetical protein
MYGEATEQSFGERGTQCIIRIDGGLCDESMVCHERAVWCWWEQLATGAASCVCLYTCRSLEGRKITVVLTDGRIRGLHCHDCQLDAVC